MAHITEP